MRLSELNTGEKGVIVKVLGHGGFRKRIVEMGFIKGKTVEVLLNAPLRDPIKYKVMGYEISLRRQEAEMIEIISEQEAKEQAVQPDYHEGLGENMHLGEDELKQLALGKRRTINVALVGNPNCGKTSLFNIASGSHEHVGNYSGVTVDAKEGYFDFQGYHFRIVDLPGTYSLSAYSPEEIYVRRHIINETPDIIINVVDSSNLERNLYLTTQLITRRRARKVAEGSAAGNALCGCTRPRQKNPQNASDHDQALGLQVLRRPDHAAPAHQHDRHRRSERLRQVQHHRRHPLGDGRIRRQPPAR